MTKHRQRVAFEAQLLSVTQLSLQTEVEAKLRAIKRLRQQIERLSEPSRLSRVDDARRLQQQIKSMLDVNRAVRITLIELEQVARELVEDLEAEDSM
jgi:N-glycosylase/DNA lyase